MAWAGYRHMASQYLDLLRSMPTLSSSAMSLLRPPRGAADGEEERGANRWFAPRTPFNCNVTNQRAFSSVSIPFAEVRHVAKANDVTINDVVLAICSGALRRYLAEANALPAESLLAAVPVSIREAGNVEMNTQAMMMRVALASDLDDPIERLRAIHRSSDAAKTLMASVRSLPTDFPSLGAPWLVSGLAALYGRSHLAERAPHPGHLRQIGGRPALDARLQPDLYEALIVRAPARRSSLRYRGCLISLGAAATGRACQAARLNRRRSR